MKRLQGTTTFFAAIFFFLSGCAALIYQTAWQRLLSLFAGSDSQAMGIIIAAFMVGLGVGHLIGGRLADQLKARQNIVCLALLEIALGVVWLLQPLALPRYSLSPARSHHRVQIHEFRASFCAAATADSGHGHVTATAHAWSGSRPRSCPVPHGPIVWDQHPGCQRWCPDQPLAAFSRLGHCRQSQSRSHAQCALFVRPSTAQLSVANRHREKMKNLNTPSPAPLLISLISPSCSPAPASWRLGWKWSGSACSVSSSNPPPSPLAHCSVSFSSGSGLAPSLASGWPKRRDIPCQASCWPRVFWPLMQASPSSA